MNDILTIIPARGGSKSIPRKNLQVINGKSLVERSVINALKIPNNNIVVSTDDKEIYQHIKKFPIKVLKRSEFNSTDTASSESVVLEVLDELRTFEGVIVLLQATCPFLDINALNSAIDLLLRSNSIDSMFSAVLKNEFIWELGKHWEPKNHDKSSRTPRQLRPPTAVETGSFYIFKSKKFMKEKTRFCGLSYPAFTKVWSSFDIDTQEDLDFCRELSTILDFPPYLV